MAKVFVRGALLCALTVTFAGCGVMFESSRVSSRFEAVFDCPNPTVSSELGGYRAEGCGVVAHFTCFETDDDDDDPPVRPGGGRLLGAMLASAVEESFEVDACVLEYSERVEEQIASEPSLPEVTRTEREEEGPVLRIQLPVAGGHVEAVGKPGLHPQHVLLTVHSIERLPEEKCRSELFHDGQPLTIDQAAAHDWFTVHLAIRVAQLKDVDRSARFAGSVCGWSFELDATARERLGQFEARFQEEKIRLARTGSGGEVPVRLPPPAP